VTKLYTAADLEAAVAERTRGLREALEKYGEHYHNCAREYDFHTGPECDLPGAKHPRSKCDCGLTAALSIPAPRPSEEPYLAEEKFGVKAVAQEWDAPAKAEKPKSCEDCKDSMEQCGEPNRVPACCWDDSSTTKPCPRCSGDEKKEAGACAIDILASRSSTIALCLRFTHGCAERNTTPY
jgi:hypothetical protein